MKMHSIKQRLFIWLSIPLGFATVIVVAIIFSLMSTNVNQHFDNSLLVASKNVEDRLYVKDGVLKFSLPHFGLDIQSSEGESSIFYSVIDAHGNLLSGHENIPKPEKIKKSIFYNTNYANQDIRALYVEHEMYRNGLIYKAIIIISETLEDRQEWILNMFLITIVLSVLVVLVAIVVSLFSVKKGIEPLLDLQYLIKKRDMNDLSPIEAKVPLEVVSLVQSINHMFVKLKKSFLHVERFNADVSHQLRTPLAELKVLMETDEVLKNSQNKELYLGIIDRMAHTTDQLLLSAKTNPDAFDRNWFQAIDFTALCEKVVKSKVPFIYNKGFEFDFEVEDDLWIHGGPIVLEGMISNLIDNSINYAIDENDQPMGEIKLSLVKKEDNIVFCLEDEGYGIPDEHLLNICDRFFRLDIRKKGSGLGLSIVKQIAQLHGATIEITNKKSKGLKVEIVFKSL